MTNSPTIPVRWETKSTNTNFAALIEGPTISATHSQETPNEHPAVPEQHQDAAAESMLPMLESIKSTSSPHQSPPTSRGQENRMIEDSSNSLKMSESVQVQQGMAASSGEIGSLDAKNIFGGQV